MVMEEVAFVLREWGASFRTVVVPVIGVVVEGALVNIPVPVVAVVARSRVHVWSWSLRLLSRVRVYLRSWSLRLLSWYLYLWS